MSNRHVNSIAGRLSLRPPQRRSLEILDRIVEIAPPRKDGDANGALEVIQSEFPNVRDFERDFPSICFSLATGVGKTRLMGAFISYLHLARGHRNFFVLAPNLTIYNKLITDFTPNTPKYVFKGIAEFAVNSPLLITGENYDQAMAGSDLFDGVRVNIFNISKINSEVRGGKAPRIKRLAEYLGQSYFDYLAALPDLVLLMDESHRYRASAGVKAINELRPVLGLELSATPYTESSRGPIYFANVVYDYTLGNAMADGFVKEAAVVTRKDFNPAGMSAEEIERIKLEDGVRLHESVKVELETYARETGNAIVKPFVLVIARDIAHASQLVDLIKSDAFFDGHYRDKIIQVDSSRSGAEEEEMISRLLKVEHTDEPTEIVIHVNMLKEGWDVTNLYTIVPLRAANARVLIEQSIGRGLRLPYGRRTGVSAVDRLNIVAHDRFQEIVDEANQPDSPVRLQSVVIDPQQLQQKSITVVSRPNVDSLLGRDHEPAGTAPGTIGPAPAPIFAGGRERAFAEAAHAVIRGLEGRPDLVPTTQSLLTPAVQQEIIRLVEERTSASQLTIEGMDAPIDLPKIVALATKVVIDQTIPIPQIQVLPRGDVQTGFRAFTLDLRNVRYPPVSDEVWIQHLRTNQTEVLALGGRGIEEVRPEDYVVSGLVDFDDVSYDDHAELLYGLAKQVVDHLHTYLSEEDAQKVLRHYQRPIAQLVHAQMRDHFWEDASAGYDVVVSKGFSKLRDTAYTVRAGESVLDFRVPPGDKSNMAAYLFGGFQRCLYPQQKFDTDTERRLAVILDRDSLKWFRPAKGQFKIFYRMSGNEAEYQPDFVAEVNDAILMLESKAVKDMEIDEVRLKREAAEEWCRHASKHAEAHGGKPWQYALIPHDVVKDNMSLGVLVQQFGS